MQDMPGLVGTGTASAVAANSLNFAEPLGEASPDLTIPAHPDSSHLSGRDFLPVRHTPTTRHPLPPQTRGPAGSVFELSNVINTNDRVRDVSNGSSNTTYTSSDQPSLVASEASVGPSSTLTLPHSAASSSQGAFAGSWYRRHSLINRGEWAPPLTSENSRDSISSNGSWIRRLSIRPLSQHGSTRSSVGLDALSLNFSLGSAAPFLSQESTTPPQQSRNRLVKRTTTSHESSATTSLSRRGSIRSQMPIFRRPATSHQRSATLQLAPFPDEPTSSASHVADLRFSLDQVARPGLPVPQQGSKSPELTLDNDRRQETNGEQNHVADAYGKLQVPQQTQQKQKGLFSAKWTSFFHGRSTKPTTTVRDDTSSLGGSSSFGTKNFSPPSRTLPLQRERRPKAYLMQAAELPAPEPALRLSPADNLERPGATSGLPIQIPSASNASWTTPKSEDDYKFLSSYDSGSSPQGTSPSSARRSISMNFSSQTSRIPKGGLDRPKRNSEYPPNASLTGSLRTNKKIGSAAISRNAPPNEQRHVSAPLARPRPFTAQPHHQHLQIRRSATPFADIDPQKPSGDATWQPCYSDANECQEDEGSSFSAQPSFVRERASLNRQRHTSSPFPPLSRFSDFNINLESLEVSPGASRLLATNKENHAYALPGLAKVSRSFPLATSSGNVLDTPSSTLAGLDLDPQDIASSVDGEDTDLKSDTIFDSIRTTASARLQSVGTPVESMFDESPPSTAGNGKAKRLSIQEILGQATDSDTRIAEEEDDGVSTPMRTICDLQNGSLIPKSVMNFRDEDSHFEFGRQDFAETKANIIFSSTTTDKSARAISSRNSRPSFEDDDGDDDWARIDDSGVTNHLSPPSRAPCDSFDETSGPIFANGPELGFSRHQRPALGLISGNGSLDPAGRHDGSIASGHERPKSTLFDWCEAAPHSDKIGSESHSPRPKTAHGKQELDLKNRRPVNRKGPAVTHARSQSVPVNLDPTTQGAKPVKPQFGTWAAGPKNASEDWDDDFDFDSNTDADADDIDENRLSGIEEDDAFGQSSTLRSSKGPNSSFAMVVPASIQATQPTVKAHSGQIRELSLLVHGLKRLCRHARDLNIVDETPALWKEAENIIALASPDEDLYETAAMKATKASAATAVTDASVKKAAPGSDSSVPRASIEFDVSGVEDQILSGQCSHESPTRFEDDLFDTSDPTQRLTSPTPPEVSRTAVVRERPHTRRRSVFSPDDDIFGGNSPRAGDKSYSAERIEAKEAHRRPQTPHRSVGTNETPDSTMIESIMEAMQQQRSASAPIRKSPVKQSPASELFFNTNTLQELVKRANSLFHTLSELVRRTELFTQSPAVTPRRDRLNRCEDGSPAFTRVFTDPSSPLKRLPKSQSGNSITRGSPALESPSTTKVSQRLQLMTLS